MMATLIMFIRKRAAAERSQYHILCHVYHHKNIAGTW